MSFPMNSIGEETMDDNLPNLTINTMSKELPLLNVRNSNVSPSSGFEHRLMQVKKAVQQATEEAFQRTDPSTELILQSENPNASFHLGMELFASSEDPAHLERSIQENLTQIERQLKDLMIEIKVKREMMGDSAADHAEVFFEKSPPLGAAAETAPPPLLDSAFLQFKIRFLRQCSQVRQCIDESSSLVDPINSNTDGQVDWVNAVQKLFVAEQEWERANQMLQSEIKSHDTDNPQPPEEALELEKARHLMELLRQDIRNPKVEILSQVQTIWQNCVTLEPETIHIRGFQPASGSLETGDRRTCLLDQVYNVLQLFDEQEGHALWQELILPFANRLYDQVMAPVLETHKQTGKGDGVVCWEFHELQERAMSSTLGAVKSLEWARDEEKTAERDPISAWTETIAFIERILVFCADNAFLGRAKFCNLFGQRLLGRPSATTQGDLRLHELGLTSFRLGNDNGILMGPLVDLMMDTCIPDHVYSNNMGYLRDIQARLELVVKPFLQTMRHKGLLSEDEYECSMEQFVGDFLQHYIHHRHSLKLSQARSLILDNDYHNTQQVGVDPSILNSDEDKKLGLDNGLDVFVLHKSCISNTAYQLYRLCLECMEESVDFAKALHDSHDRALADLPATLYQAARQVLDLYRAIVPVRYGKEATEVPRTAAIFYNDCVYLAHHCLSLGIRYREKYPDDDSQSNNSLRRVCIFVDKVPLFRDMADRCMRQMLERQAHQIQELVKGRVQLLGAALRSEDILAEWADAETALNAGLYHLRHVAQQWKPILSRNIFDSTVGYLAHVLFTLFLEPVLSARDFSTAACEFVHDLFGKALDNINEMLESRIEGVQTWHRFRAVGQFMDMSLNDVEAALSEGVFASVTGQELTKLLMAAFDESPRRQYLLKLLNNSG